MISDQTVDRYYYIFDARDRRALVLDRSTGEEVVWSDAPRVQLIDYVAEIHSTPILRRFARWCARQTGVEKVSPDTVTGRLWSAAQPSNPQSNWSEVRADTNELVVEAAALGLPQRNSDAARLLGAHACTHSTARQAAIDAAHMSERWAEFDADGASQAAVQDLRQRQIDWLLDTLGAHRTEGERPSRGEAK
jgi:hypothetical protein